MHKRVLPDLASPDWLHLFELWYDKYCALIEVRRAKALRKVIEFGEQAVRENPPTFRCRCGEVTADPLDPEQMRIQQPHFIAASLERTHDGLECWRRASKQPPAWATAARYC